MTTASWAAELAQGIQTEFGDKREKAFSEIDRKLGDKVICSACGCTIATFGERCGGPSMPELLASGETCEGQIAILDAAPGAPDDLFGWSFLMDRRMPRFKLTFGPAPIA